MSLSPKQRATLKTLAHPLKPILQIGKEGVTQAGLEAIENAFNQRELLKVKIQGAAPISASDAATEVVDKIVGVEHVQTIGRTIILFRRHPRKPEIVLPA